jgi:hypothetical protein
MADPRLRDRLDAAIDREAKIPRALESLGPVAGRQVLLVDALDGLRAGQLAAMGAVVSTVGSEGLAALPDASADVIITYFTAIRPGEEPAAEQIAHVMRVLDPAGRLLVVHDYGRDDVASLLGSREREEQLMGWSHRNGPFLVNGFKVKVLHCWWSWDTLEEAVGLLRDAFGAAGAALGESMRRPRLSYKVAVYHRDHESVPVVPGPAGAAAG